MGLLIGGIALNFVGTVVLINKTTSDPLGSSAAGTIFIALGVGSLLVSLVGAILVGHGTHKKVGGVLAIIGSIIYVPLGLVAIFGAKRAMAPSADKPLDKTRGHGSEPQQTKSD